MTVLARTDIAKLVESNQLKITPFVKSNIEPASYDCLLGDILEAGVGKIKLDKGQDFTLESNSWASISSREIFALPNNICASYGIRSGLARRGVIAFGGPQIDPGYEGRIFISLYNPTLEPIVLRGDQKILSIIFYEMSCESKLGYQGPYQGQRDFPSTDVEFMMRMRSRNLSDVIDNVETLDHSVKELSTSLKGLTTDVHEIKKVVIDAKPWIQVFTAIISAAALAGIGWVVVQALSSYFTS